MTRSLRDELQAAGFVVAGLPFRYESDEPVYAMTQVDAFGRLPSSRAELDGRQYSLALPSGRWNHWGVDTDGAWHPMEELLAVDQQLSAESPKLTASDTVSNPSDPGPFVKLCLQNGFELADDITRQVDFGNRFVARNGMLYLANEQAALLIDPLFQTHRLFDLLPGPTSLEQVTSYLLTAAVPEVFDDRPQTAPHRTTTPLLDVPKFSGRTHQPSLF